ncbi:MAG: helix-turn-helix transcriptional regulator, partial [Glaciecola sp.]|nr:helix-turn-helix transcriptional regulator [Glaciecola sp.]
FIKHYQGLFHCSIAFNQTQLALCFHPDILSFKVYNIAQPLKTKISQQTTQSQHIGKKIEELISMGLASGNINIDVIGHSLGLHPRKLQRLLAQESLSYSQILDNVRQQHARQYIARTQFDMSSIAYMLGYKNLATFSRECKKWFGMSPSKLRRTMKTL